MEDLLEAIEQNDHDQVMNNSNFLLGKSEATLKGKLFVFY